MALDIIHHQAILRISSPPRTVITNIHGNPYSHINLRVKAVLNCNRGSLRRKSKPNLAINKHLDSLVYKGRHVTKVLLPVYQAFQRDLRSVLCLKQTRHYFSILQNYSDSSQKPRSAVQNGNGVMVDS